MKAMPDGCVDAVVTDPPAGIGFMGKYWDHHKGGRATWVCWLTGVMAECLRLARPGAHALVWALPRTSHWTATALEDAGWIIEDRIAHVFGQGFPKHKSKLKPAVEDWWLCTKTGGEKWLGVDSCRVGTGEDRASGGLARVPSVFQAKGCQPSRPTGGRWPTNLAMTHHPACVPCGTRRVNGSNFAGHPVGRKNQVLGKDLRPRMPSGYVDVDGMETVAAWECHESCPVREMDRQSGERKSGKLFPHHADNGKETGCLGSFAGKSGRESYGDSGGASRFFPTFAWQADDFTPWLYCGKATRKDRNEGCEGMPPMKRADDGYGTIQQPKIDRQSPRENWTPHETANHHPTVKPTQLMRWLCRLVTSEGGTILDPFMGSGSTLKAAVLEGFSAIGIESDPDYVVIAERRVAAARAEMPLFAS